MATVAEVFDLALKRLQAGDFSQAEQLCRGILRADPSLANAWCFLGAACQSQGKLGEAIQSYQAALRLKPDYAEAYYNLALALEAAGQRDAAIVQFHQALACNPDYAEAIQELGRVLEEQEKLALDLRGRGQPRQQLLLYAQAHYNLGVVRARQGQLDEAIAQYRQALRLNPESAETHNNLASALHQKGQLDEAVGCYHQALRCRPDCAEAYTNLGAALTVLGRLDEAVACYQQALRINPHFAEVCNNLGEALKELGQLDEALANFDQALQLKPGFAEPRWNRSLLWLLLGDFAKGWSEYEWRWTQANMPRRSFPQPLWDGSALDGRTILLDAEQGLGDTLHFIRYVPLVRERGGNVIVECQPALLRLLAEAGKGPQGLSRKRPVTPLVGRGSPLLAFEVQAPLLSLPRIFNTSLATIPANVPYLHADAELVGHWRQEMRKSPKSEVQSPKSNAPLPTSDIGHRTSDFLVGIAWQGSPTYRYDRQRSIPLAHFAALAKVEGVHLISLQKGPGAEQLRAMAGQFPVVDLGNRLDETSGAFMDSAALMKNLDLVICSDTAIPHLAGALADPVWVALPLVPDWRWLLQREDCPWYPTMRLFRQTRCDRWEDVFERLAEELKAVVSC